MENHKIKQELECIYRLLDNIEYECSARQYTLDQDSMSNIYAARDLVWLLVKKMEN